MLNYAFTLSPRLVMTAGADAIGLIIGQHNANSKVSFGAVQGGTTFPLVDFDGQNAPSAWGVNGGAYLECCSGGLTVIMVVWEDGRMKKSGYRKFIIKTVPQNDDFASMREVVGRRYRRLQEEKKPLPDLILVDGGVGQLHAAAGALEALQIINQPLAAIAKKEEILYVWGRENEPVVLDHHSPALHLVQQIRDEAHRFAVTFHRARRSSREIASELLGISGVGERTVRKVLAHFGSVSALKSVSAEELGQVVRAPQAKRIYEYLQSHIENR